MPIKLALLFLTLLTFATPVLVGLWNTRQAASVSSTTEAITQADTGTLPDNVEQIIVSPSENTATATQIPAEPTTAPTCALTINHNLNMRSGPSEDSEWILTIPAFTSVMSTGRNELGWWQVSYDDASGWVSGEYLTPDRSCEALPVTVP